MLIAQITDLHIRPRGRLAYGRVDTNGMLEACVASIRALPRQPDVLLISGDLTDCGLAEEYEVLREILAPLTMPVYVIPGNHDRRETLRAAFADHGYLPNGGGYLNYVIDDHPVRLIGLDTVVAGEGFGEMDQARLDWLATTLAAGGARPTVIFMHHPPFITGIASMDAINCRGGDGLAAIVGRFANVERVLAGHHHRPVQIRWAGTIGMVAPSPAHQVMLDLDGVEADAKIKMEPPAYCLHQWTPETGTISHQCYVGTFDGPWPFTLDPDYPAYKG